MRIFYGPACQPSKYGGQDCATSPVAGIRVAATTYPGRRPLGLAVSHLAGQLQFASLPFSIAFAFERGVHGHLYEVGWYLKNLGQIGGQVHPLAVLLCPSGGWVVTAPAVADSCSDPGGGVIAAHGPPGSP